MTESNEHEASPKYTGRRACLFCTRGWDMGEAEAMDGWTTVRLGSDDYHRCPDCTAEGREVPASQGDPLTPVGEVAKASLDQAAADVAERGGRMIAGFTMIVADGLEGATGGMWFEADEEQGPQDPQERVAFMLAGVRAFAEAQGVPMAVMDVPELGGQG